ncbi:MAG: fused MFS/spermidine synthase [Thermomicrobiales bacterium]|nr:fused MFS/spermidine synthase [Thermomicrobiales bacterium]
MLASNLHRLDFLGIRTMVFVGGLVSIGAEICATNLIAPYFGESTFIWATVIGLTLTFLAIGYHFGGKLADRYPQLALLYLTGAIAAIAIGLLPYVAQPILSRSLTAFADYDVGAFYGALIGILLLLAIPITLLGFVSPFAVRLTIDAVDNSGGTAGSIYALGTIGSIAGSFLPVLLLVPWIGTRRTFLVLSLLLLVPSLLGLISKRSWRSALAASVLAMGMIVANVHISSQPIRASQRGEIIYETESSDNYIQVTQDGTQTLLWLNDGHAIHSIYDPTSLLTGGPWDYFMIGPFFVEQPQPVSIENALIIGLGGGTTAKQLTVGYGPIPIDGVEIDAEIVRVGREYFDMNEPNLHVIVQDGRYVLRTTETRYDLIAVDAYEQPYIPFQLTTQEFFTEVSNALTPTGTAVMNVGRTSTDYRLVDAMSSTMKSVFRYVYVVDTDRYTNSMVIGTNAPGGIAAFTENVASAADGPLRTVGETALATGNIREVTDVHQVFTDDHAPVQHVVDMMIINAALPATKSESEDNP